MVSKKIRILSSSFEAASGRVEALKETKKNSIFQREKDVSVAKYFSPSPCPSF